MIKKELIPIVLIVILVNITLVSANSNIIFLKSRNFIPESGITIQERANIEAIGQRANVILQLNYIPKKEERKLFEHQTSVKLLSYIPDKAYFASIPTNQIDQVLAHPLVRSISEILPNDRITQDIKTNGINEYSTNELDEAKLYVDFFGDISLEERFSLITGFSGKVLESSPFINGLVIFLPKNKIYDLVSNNNIHWINQHYPLEALNNGSRIAIGVNRIQEAPFNLTGTGVSIGEWDSGCVSNTHDDLKGRVFQENCSFGGLPDHATHVAGTMLGNGSRSKTEGATNELEYRGMATNATLVSWYHWSTPTEGYVQYDFSIQNYDIDLSQNSWDGGDFDGDYDEKEQAIDNITRGSLGKRIPIIWAAGNLGLNNWGGMRHAVAKNLIAVGGTNSVNDSRYSLSTRGPTADGRTKPDIMAVACHNDTYQAGILSTNITNSYSRRCGTSMAAPAVSGTVALMLEYWRNISNGLNPLPSTHKATLIQTAKDLNNTGPDFATGYGRINATDAIIFIRDGIDTNIFEANISNQGENDTYSFDVPEGQSELKITLVWDDYPGDPAVSKALVNNLDLIVTAPNGSRYFPWTLNNNTPEKPAIRNQSDNLNNVEQVYANTTDYGSLRGVWNVVVSGTSVPNPEPDQTYSLVNNILTRKLTACDTLNLLSTVYILQNDVNTTSTCFTIKANGITLDLNGFNLTGDANSGTDYGVNITGYNGTTIKNGGIYNFGKGIHSTKAHNGNFNNLTIKASGNFGFLTTIYAIGISYGNNHIVTNNNLSGLSNTGSSSLVYTLEFYQSSNNVVENNTVDSNSAPGGGGSSADGIRVIGGSNNTLIRNTANSNGRDGIINSGSSNNKLIDNIANSNSRYGFYIAFTSQNNLFSGGSIKNSSQHAIWLNSNTMRNNNFTNINISGTNSVYYDIIFNVAGINNTYLIDMPNIGNYSIANPGSLIHFKNTQFGEIKFLSAINGSGTNLTKDVKIAFNFTGVLSDNNPGLNKPANITLYSMVDGFTNPKILRNHLSICNTTTSPSCYAFTSLNAGTVIFNVSSWTNYTIGESP